MPHDRLTDAWRMWGAPVLIAALAWGSVAWSAGSSAEPPSVSVSVKVGETIPIAGGLAVRFDEVLQDSRCPQGAVCVWAGNARVALTVSRPGGKPVRIELNTNLEPKSREVFGRRIELAGLSPAPKAGEKIDPKGYAATLKVE